MTSWHMDKKLMVGIIGGVVLNAFAAIWQGLYIIKTLDTNPPLIDRLIALEYHASSHGRTNEKILDKLDDVVKLVHEFGEEQARRRTTVHDAASHMKDRGLHK